MSRPAVWGVACPECSAKPGELCSEELADEGVRLQWFSNVHHLRSVALAQQEREP